MSTPTHTPPYPTGSALINLLDTLGDISGALDRLKLGGAGARGLHDGDYLPDDANLDPDDASILLALTTGCALAREELNDKYDLGVRLVNEWRASHSLRVAAGLEDPLDLPSWCSDYADILDDEQGAA